MADDIQFEPIEFEPESPEQAQVTSVLGALGAGAAKGVTFGFDDELAGIAKAIYDKAGGESKKDFWDIYKDVRDSVRKYHKEAEEQHPVASLGGELAGGLGTALVMPVGAVAKGAGFLTKAGQMAKAGAAYGALSGLGTSEADLTKGEVGQAAKDVASGAASGAVIGAGMQAAGTALKSAGKGIYNVASKYPVVKNFAKTFQLSREGEDLLGAVQKLSEHNRNVLTDDIIDTLESARQFSGSIMGEGIDEIEKKQGAVKVLDIINNLREKAAKIVPNTADEEADINTFLKSLDRYAQKETKNVIKYIPKAQRADFSPAEKVVQGVAKKTAEAEAKDAIKIGELSSHIENLMAKGADEDELAPFISKLRKLQSGTTEFPPETIAEPVTGLDVLGVSRGVNKQPIVAAKAIEGLPSPKVGEIGEMTPIQKLISQVTTEAETRKPSDVTDFISNIGKSLQDKNISPQQRELLSDLQSQLQERFHQSAKLAGPEAAEGAELYEAGKELFKPSARAQETLGLPRKVIGTDAREAAKARLHNLVKSYQKEGSEGRILLDNALNELQKSFPEDAARLRKAISEGSTKEYLAHQLQGESSLGGAGYAGPVQASAKSVKLNIARALGKGVGAVERIPENVSQRISEMGKALYSYSPQQFQNMANAAASKGGTFGQHMSQVLQNLPTLPDAKRRAVLFTLMQQPDFRDFAQNFIGGE